MWRGAWLRRARVLAASPSVIRVKNAHATSPSASHWWRQHGGVASTGAAGGDGARRLRRVTEGEAAGAGVECDARALRDTADVAEDVLVRVQPELAHGDEAAVHGLRCSGTDAVVVGDVQDELEVGAIIQRSACENVFG